MTLKGVHQHMSSLDAILGIPNWTLLLKHILHLLLSQNALIQQEALTLCHTLTVKSLYTGNSAPTMPMEHPASSFAFISKLPYPMLFHFHTALFLVLTHLLAVASNSPDAQVQAADLLQHILPEVALLLAPFLLVKSEGLLPLKAILSDATTGSTANPIKKSFFSVAMSSDDLDAVFAMDQPLPRYLTSVLSFWFSLDHPYDIEETPLFWDPMLWYAALSFMTLSLFSVSLAALSSLLSKVNFVAFDLPLYTSSPTCYLSLPRTDLFQQQLLPNLLRIVSLQMKNNFGVSDYDPSIIIYSMKRHQFVLLHWHYYSKLCLFILILLIFYRTCSGF
jgi:hypothetical protein